MTHPPSLLRGRSVFISDIHLGTPDCKAEYLLDFLEHLQCDTLYLVGDIVDLVYLKRRIQFPAAQQQVVDKLLAIAAGPTRVLYIPGNHDAALRRFCGQILSGIEIHEQAVYYRADGRRFLVSHGDELDACLHAGVFWQFVGDWSHSAILRLNTVVNQLRRACGLPYWSLATHIKRRIDRADAFIARFEQLAARRAGEHAFDGYIGGHIHVAGMRYIDGVMYCNDGDWVEHCSALIERADGTLDLVQWTGEGVVLLTEPEPELEPAVTALGRAIPSYSTLETNHG